MDIIMFTNQISSMEQAIINYVRYKATCINIENSESIKKIYNLFTNKQLFSPESSTEYYYIGCYYKINRKYDMMEANYEMAVNKGEPQSMYELGCHHQNVTRNYSKMKYYYHMAIKENNHDAMNCLGIYYIDIKKNYIKSTKYYLMAIKNNNSFAWKNLCNHYNINNMHLDLFELYVLYPQKINESRIIVLIKNIIQKNLHTTPQFITSFTKFLNDNNHTIKPILLLCLSNSQKIDF